MKTNNLILSSLLILSLIILKTSFAQDYIVLNSFDVNIRTGPATDYFVVCTAGKGEIFELLGENGDWVEVRMFSEENRYIHRDMVYFLEEFIDGHNMRLPDDEKIKTIQKASQWAKTISANEAGEIIPRSISEERFVNFKNICFDKNMHDIFEIQGIQPALFLQIVNQKEKN